MLSETDILDRHNQSLKEARDHCLWLAKQQDETQAAPRGRRYIALRKALDQLEGSCRQMAHFRADARWVKLGVVYAKAMRLAQAKYIGQNWKAFGQMVAIFERGLHSLDELANRKTETRGAILPSQPTDWLILPDWKPFAGAFGDGTTH